MGSEVVGDDPAAVAVGEQRVVPHRHQPRRGRNVGVGEWGSIDDVEQFVAVDRGVGDEPIPQRIERGSGHRHRLQAELGEVGNRSRAERKQVAAHERSERLVHRRASCRRRPLEHRVAAERPRRAGRCVGDRGEGPERPPQARLVAHVVGQVLENLCLRSWGVQEVEQPGDRSVGVVSGQVGVAVAAVVEAGSPEERCRRVVKGRVVVGRDGVQRDPHQRSLDQRPIGERSVDVAEVQIGDAVPQPNVRCCRRLRLQASDPLRRLADGDRRSLQQQLAVQRRSVQLGGADDGHLAAAAPVTGFVARKWHCSSPPSRRAT